MAFHLILKYLRTKLAPLFAAVAVTLCTAMVLTVISVMGGFLDTLKQSARQLTGDVVITNQSLVGFAHYEPMAAALEARPEIALTTPALRTYALISLFDADAQPVEVVGIDPEAFARIVPFEDTLKWSAADADSVYRQGLADAGLDPEVTDALPPAVRARLASLAQDMDLTAAAMSLTPAPLRRYWVDSGIVLLGLNELAQEDLRAAERQSSPEPNESASLTPYEPELAQLPGAVLGIEISPTSTRDERGQYSFRNSIVDRSIKLTFVPLNELGSVEEVSPVKRRFTVVNEFKSGLYDVDSRTVYVSFDLLQTLLKLAPTQLSVDPETLEPLEEPLRISGRSHELICKAADGYSAEQVRIAAEEVIAAMRDDRSLYPPLDPYVHAQRWDEQHAQFLSAVQNEKGLMTFLFVIISVVAIVMVASTFYMFVLEKTRDIGTLRAIGASSWSVLTIFLGYGLAIGLIGSLAGIALAVFIVTHLNELQAALAHRMVTLIAVAVAGLLLLGATFMALLLLNRRRGNLVERVVWPTVLIGILLTGVIFFLFPSIQIDALTALDDKTGWVMWDPRLYFFESIPSRIDPVEAVTILIGAVISSVIGALIPAIIAAALKPVEALRHE